MAPSVPSSGSVSTSLAPNARMIRLLSIETLAGMQSSSAWPRTAHTIASATPVFPLVASRTVRPRRRRPSSSAARTIQRPGRSLTLPPGLALSTFAQSSPRSPAPMRCSGTSGVSPMRSRIVPRTRSRTSCGVSPDIAKEARGGPRSGPDGLQCPPREAQRFVGIAAGFRRARPPVEDHAKELRSALLRELASFLKGPPRGRAVALHPQLADQHHRAHLRVDLVHLSCELERGLGFFERRLGIALRQHLGLRRPDRGEGRIAFGFGGQSLGAGQAFSSARGVAVLDVESSRIVERARHLVEKPEVLVDLEAALVVEDRRFEVARLVVGLRHSRVEVRERRPIVELLG